MDLSCVHSAQETSLGTQCFLWPPASATPSARARVYERTPRKAMAFSENSALNSLDKGTSRRAPFSLVDLSKTGRESVFPSRRTDDTIVFTVVSYTQLSFFSPKAHKALT